MAKLCRIPQQRGFCPQERGIGTIGRWSLNPIAGGIAVTSTRLVMEAQQQNHLETEGCAKMLKYRNGMTRERNGIGIGIS
tara:strand:- start:63 stop:302 length:240 start_codon:yes stop_codon:yes gene_type:complete